MLGSIEDLLHARAITDALLNRLAASTSEAAEEESHVRQNHPSLFDLLLDESFPWEALEAEQSFWPSTSSRG